MRFLALSTGVLLAACATNEPPPPPPPAEAPDRGMQPAPVIRSTGPSLEEIETAAGGTPDLERLKDFLPFIDVAMNPSAADSDWGVTLEDHYTRIRIETLNPKATDMEATASGEFTRLEADRDYKKESRGWFSRMMSSKAVTRTLLAEFDISKPNIKATEALFSATFTSNRQEGESWSTDQSLALYATPWFKVSSGTTLTATMRMQLSDQRERTGASANVLSSLTTAANLIAPSTALVTYFNAPAMTAASNYLDTSVSTLFGRAITEQSTGTMALKSWDEGPLLVVYAAMPDPKDIRKTKNRDMLGGWAIYLEEPIVSVFTSGVQYDDEGYESWPDYSNLTGPDILSYKISEDLTVFDYIFSRLDLSDRIANLNDTGDPQIARLICTRIDRGMVEIGFNSWDAAAGVMAAAKSDQLNALAQQALTREETCAAMERYALISEGEVTPKPVAPVMEDEAEAETDF